ncbi:MAG: hypothetical protein JXR05_15385 [Flavobacteriaceae bacterium]
MKSKIIFLIFITVVMISCDNDDKLNSPLINSDIIRVEEDLFLNAPNDDFEIITATISNNKLNLTILYGGGCGNIYYDLVTGNDYMGTNPIQKNIRLAFDDEDNCEAGIELELSFDLTQIQVSSTDRIIINLDRWEDQIEYSY